MRKIAVCLSKGGVSKTTTEDYCEIAKNRIEQEAQQLKLFSIRDKGKNRETMKAA